jgi:hypothetical protein
MNPFDRARRYLEKIPPAVAGNGGDEHTFKTCCALVRGFDLTEDQALALLLADWNTSCSPPWTEAELRTKVRSARRSGQGEPGYLLGDNGTRRATASPADAPPERETKPKGWAACASTWSDAHDLDDPAAAAGRAYWASRGLKVPDPLPSALQFHPRLEYYRQGIDGKPELVDHFPAVLCLVTDAKGKHCGLQRIYLAADGRSKAPLPDGLDPKKALGTLKGGAVRLDEPRPGEPLVIAEGLETALACREATGLATWAAVSSAGMAALVVPAEVGEVVIAADLDRSNAGEDAANKLAARLHAQGVRVRIALPAGEIAEGAKGVDWLDVLNNKGAEAVREAIERAEAWEPAGGDGKPRLTFTAMRDLLAEPDEAIDYLVVDHLPSGGISVIAGKPKAGKSTLAHGLAFAVARGVPWLGKATRQGVVFYLALEEKRSELKHHFREMGATDADPIHVFVGQAPADAVAQLAKAAAVERPALIIVDTMQRLVRATDTNDYAVMTMVLEPLLMIARQTGAHVHLLHHAGKGVREGIDAILGSTAIAGSVDTVFILRRGDRYRSLSSQQRYGVDLEEVVIELDERRRPVAAGNRADLDRDHAGAEIRKVLAVAATPLTREEIEEQVEGKTVTIRGALKALVQGEEVARTGKGKKGDAFRYALANPGDSEQVAAEAPENSCSLVPYIYGEQENRKRKSDVTTCEIDENSCSPAFAGSDGVGNKKNRAAEGGGGNGSEGPPPLTDADFAPSEREVKAEALHPWEGEL